MRVVFAIALSLMTFVAAEASAKPAVPPLQVVRPLPASAAPRSIEFTRAATQMVHGQRVGSRLVSPMCIRGDEGEIYWEGGAIEALRPQWVATFNDVAKRAGFVTSGDPGSLFATSNASAAEFEIAANVKGVRGDLCKTLYRDIKVKAWAFIDIEWQVFSPLKREVVARIQTTGAYDVLRAEDGGFGVALGGAFADNVTGLMNAEAFRAIVLAPGGPAAATAAATPGDRTPIELTKPQARPADLPEMVGSVVTVLSGEGHGSGFLVSDQGYIITNQHVTAGAKQVKIRWSDKLETVGEVLREEKGRDVALIKTEPRGRAPLTLRRGTPALGTEVYAIGAPLNEAFQGSVTRGIVSASNRLIDGFSYIQSDVMVNPGNSGGPLVNKEGDVLGIVQSGYRPDGAATGINFFIPAGDALDFLGLK